MCKTLPRQAHIALAVASFYGLAGDSMHNMNFSLILIPASGPIVSFKFSILCTSSSRTLPWPISTAVARKLRAASSPAKSTSPQDSSTPSAPPATAPPKNASPPANSKSSSPSSASHRPTHHHQQHPKNDKGETSRPRPQLMFCRLSPKGLFLPPHRKSHR